MQERSEQDRGVELSSARSMNVYTRTTDFDLCYTERSPSRILSIRRDRKIAQEEESSSLP